MARYIDADNLKPLELLEYIYQPVPDGNPWYRADDVWDLLDQMEGTDVAPVVHARWVDEGKDPNDPGSENHQYLCPKCNHRDIHASSTEVPYCWFCGAQMDEEVE